MSLGPPAAADVGEAQWQFSTADGFFAGVGTCASSNCSLYTTNGMLQTGFKLLDTNRCVCKGPKRWGPSRPTTAQTERYVWTLRGQPRQSEISVGIPASLADVFRNLPPPFEFATRLITKNKPRPSGEESALQRRVRFENPNTTQ
ncbi:hypothetical protein AVEN_14807-1 [Araneus ventricosus]|uniref:Uncharacterized protein n=1 Tax=Araneus ventricosus TaxID=182803 RepID=A0A4Y2FJY7_ARAVE|nr:hypothetical protein AVEN_14807-1 [Araneus ventricosus]